MPTPERVPTATYRLQLRREFGFRDAAAVVPYLAELGVSHVYCSPVLAAVPDSPHGYDVVDHTRMSEDLGGEAAWLELVDACHRHGLGIVVDVVPNHMAVPTPERLNGPLWDVLSRGPAATHAHWFDIDWDAGDGRLLMPLLGKPFDEAVRDGDLESDPAAGVVRYFDHELPLTPRSGSGDTATDLLQAQHYRLAFWRVANEELNYRRFFDVTTLIGLRVEEVDVFEATHRRLLRAVAEREIDGLRIDHPDGLADPGGYLERLRTASGGVWTVVEKILEGREVLPRTWACDGTTGYDALAAVTGVLVDRAGESPLTELYADLAGRSASFPDVVTTGKRMAVQRLFPAEVDRLVRDLAPVRAADPGVDLSTRGLREAIESVLVHFDVYRAYAGDNESRHHLDSAFERAAAERPDRRRELSWLHAVLAGERGGADAAAFVTRFEQTTGPVTAKGVEDTAFYRYLRLVALNEVGGDPGEFGRDVAAWHDYCARTARDWPATMTTLSTHDTKRSEDVRARLLVLAEIPATWRAAVEDWQRRLGTDDPNTDYLLWQTLVGAHPISAERLTAYLEKAVKEAKERTSWTDPDEDYENAVRERVRRLYADQQLLADVGRWVDEHLVEPGRSNALAQKLLQLTMPGVPDVYQGQELPDFSLVDPDNRRAVDYPTRRHALDHLDDADPKLRVTAAALRLRRERPGSFAGAYVPLEVTGPGAAHAIAYRRGDDVVAVVTRLPVGLRARGGWADGTTVHLPAGRWRNVLTGEFATSQRASDLMHALPVALLVRERDDAFEETR